MSAKISAYAFDLTVILHLFDLIIDSIPSDSDMSRYCFDAYLWFIFH